MIAACDGLLLFERHPNGVRDRDFFVCDPVARRWAAVPRTPGTFMLPCGFYTHEPSGKHRVLCVTNGPQAGWSHHVCSLEAAEARRLGPAPLFVPIGSALPLHHVALRGRLHWLGSRYPPVLLPMDSGRYPGAEETGKIVAFDTESETFRRIRRPPLRVARYSGGRELSLLQVDGMLAMADFLDGSMELWVLADHDDDASWTLRVRVDLPSPLRRACWAMNPRTEGQEDVILLGDRGRCWVALYDVTGKEGVGGNPACP